MTPVNMMMWFRATVSMFTEMRVRQHILRWSTEEEMWE